MNVTKDSDDDAVESAIGHCIRFLRREGGREIKQIQAICIDTARKKTGKSLGKKE